MWKNAIVTTSGSGCWVKKIPLKNKRGETQNKNIIKADVVAADWKEIMPLQCRILEH
jgi:hypothetical protein